jgi:hypothetical protein
MNAEIKTAAELIRIAFAWSYAEDDAEEAALEQKLKTMIADLESEERGSARLAICDAGADVQALKTQAGDECR